MSADPTPAGTGRVALVTGATRGVGLATARRLCAGGYHVFVNYATSDADAAAAVGELDGLAGGATAVKGDVTDPAALDRLLDRVEQQCGRLDVFVHNVSSLRPMDAVAPRPDAVHADLSTALDPLLHGVARIVKLMPADTGRIIAVSSIGAHRVIPKYVSLGLAKAALENLVRYLAVELAGSGIAVNAVSAAKLDKGGPPGPRELALAERSPSGRLVTPGDVAGVIWLLCADEARVVQGQVISVDGGLGLRAP